MLNKIKSILGSIRFYEVVIAVGIKLLAFYGLVPIEIADAVASVLGVSVIIGTVDKSFDKIGGK